VPVHGKIWADKIAVFGESSRELYITSGNPAEKIVITGNPYWDNWGPCSSHDVEKIKEALGLNRDKKVVMFAPTWYHNFNTADDPELKIKRDLEILLDTISQLKLIDKVDLLVKLHGGHKVLRFFSTPPYSGIRCGAVCWKYGCRNFIGKKAIDISRL
jgi:CDP-glycerol glycerophosphotransferase (TagB/SpsB family)